MIYFEQEYLKLNHLRVRGEEGGGQPSPKGTLNFDPLTFNTWTGELPTGARFQTLMLKACRMKTSLL